MLEEYEKAYYKELLFALKEFGDSAEQNAFFKNGDMLEANAIIPDAKIWDCVVRAVCGDAYTEFMDAHSLGSVGNVRQIRKVEQESVWHNVSELVNRCEDIAQHFYTVVLLGEHHSSDLDRKRKQEVLSKLLEKNLLKCVVYERGMKLMSLGATATVAELNPKELDEDLVYLSMNQGIYPTVFNYVSLYNGRNYIMAGLIASWLANFVRGSGNMLPAAPMIIAILFGEYHEPPTALSYSDVAGNKLSTPSILVPLFKLLSRLHLAIYCKGVVVGSAEKDLVVKNPDNRLDRDDWPTPAEEKARKEDEKEWKKTGVFSLFD